MKRIAMFLAAAALLVPLALIAQTGPAAGGGRGMMGMRAGRGMMEHRMQMQMRHPGGPEGFLQMADELQLTDQQKDKLKSLQSDFRLANVDRRAALEKAQIRLADLLRDQGPVADVNRAIDDVAKLRADMEKSRYAHMQEMKGVLTPDQVKKLKELREQRQTDRREMMRKWRQDNDQSGDTDEDNG